MFCFVFLVFSYLYWKFATKCTLRLPQKKNGALWGVNWRDASSVTSGLGRLYWWQLTGSPRDTSQARLGDCMYPGLAASPVSTVPQGWKKEASFGLPLSHSHAKIKRAWLAVTCDDWENHRLKQSAARVGELELLWPINEVGLAHCADFFLCVSAYGITRKRICHAYRYRQNTDIIMWYRQNIDIIMCMQIQN